MSWGEHHRIETPEQIDFNLEVAGPGSRFCAQALDWVFKGIATAVLMFCVFVFAAAVGSPFQVDRLGSPETYVIWAVGVATIFVLFFGYDVYYEGCCNGQTPGKRACGLRVVRDTGGPIDVQAACIRNLVGFADFLPFFYVGGGLVCIFNSRGQRLGDMAAATVVIRERASSLAHITEPRVSNLYSEEFHFTSEHLARCTATDQNILRSFFGRFPEMDGEARRGLAVRLRDGFLQKTGYQPATPIQELSRTIGFLASLYRDLSAHRQNA
jgi:uncharacterized RDD family membrane protein YckC